MPYTQIMTDIRNEMTDQPINDTNETDETDEINETEMNDTEETEMNESTDRDISHLIRAKGLEQHIIRDMCLIGSTISKWTTNVKNGNIKEPRNLSLQTLPKHVPFPLFVDTSDAITYSKLPAYFLENKPAPQQILVSNLLTKNEDDAAIIDPVLKKI